MRWSGFDMQNSVDAVQIEQFTTLSDCLSYCVSNPRCVAVDFDTSATPCWIHTDISNLDDDNTFSIPGISQYRISRACTTNGTYCAALSLSSSSSSSSLLQFYLLPVTATADLTV